MRILSLLNVPCRYLLILSNMLWDIFPWRWRVRISFNIHFLLLSIVAGLGSALFAIATDKAYEWCMYVFHHFSYFVFIYIPVIFGLIVFLLIKYFPHAGGSGLPQGYALEVLEHDKLHATYSLKTMLAKIGLTFLSILGGASLGREGPTIQICASIFSTVKRISVKRRKFLIRIGSGVGVATAFNAPLGGIIFALEEYIKHSDSKMNVMLLAGVGIAGYFTVLLTGDYSYMGYINIDKLYYTWQGIVVALCSGVLCGLCGALFTWLIVLVSVEGRINTFFHKFRARFHVANALIFGVIIAGLGVISNGLSFGNGSATTFQLLNDNITAPWYFGLVKALGAIFSVAAGVPGGYFSTSLSIGAGVMGFIHDVFPILPAPQFYLLGMVGFLAAITQAPITAVVMIMSIASDTQHFALPLILTALLSSYIASIFGDSVYHQQVLLYIKKEDYHATLH